MKIYMQKIELFRPNTNPKNKELDLDIDWAVEYDDITKEQMKFNIILKSFKNFTLFSVYLKFFIFIYLPLIMHRTSYGF